MERREMCWDLFWQNGQIGYYLLGCQLKQEEEGSGGTVSEGQRSCSAQQRL